MKKRLWALFLTFVIALSSMQLNPVYATDTKDLIGVYQGHVYRIFENSVSSEIERGYSDRGGHLATISSEEENEYLFNFMQECGYDAAFFGAMCDSDDHWRWSNDEAFTYSNWSKYEAFTYGVRYPYSVMYVGNGGFDANSYPNGEWRSYDFNDIDPYICEWDDVSYLDHVNNVIWKASSEDNGLPAGSKLGENLYTMFEMTYYEDDTTDKLINDIDFYGYSTHPTMTGHWGDTSLDSEKTTALKYVAQEDGVLTAYFTWVSEGKIVTIAEEGKTRLDIPEMGVCGSDGREYIQANVEAGKTYYILCLGGRGHFSGVGFEAGASVVEQEVEFNIPKPLDNSWTVSEDYALCPIGTELMTGLTTTFKNTSVHGGYITSIVDPKWNNGKIDNGGVALRYSASRHGTLTIDYVDLASGKTIVANKSGGNENSPLVSYTNNTTGKVSSSISVDVEPGTVYYIYGKGTKMRFTGATFGGDTVDDTNESERYMSDDDARDFLCFMYNANFTESEVSDDLYYRMLTGNLADDEDADVVKIAFLTTLNAQLNRHIKSSSYKINFIYDDLLNYFDKLLCDSMELSDDEFDELLSETIFEGVSVIIQSLKPEKIKKLGINIIDHEAAINLAANACVEVFGAAEKGKEYAEAVVAGVEAALLTYDQELAGRYSYFSVYLSNRKAYSDETVLDMIMSYNEMAIKNNYPLGTLDWYVGSADSWTEHIDDIKRYADAVYEVEKSLKSTDATSDDNEESSNVIISDGNLHFNDSEGNAVIISDAESKCISRVVNFTAGNPWTTDSLDMNPEEIIGLPDRGDATNGKAITLGTDGSIIAEFGSYVVDGTGNDIFVFEVGGLETARVEVSADMKNWYNIGDTYGQIYGLDLSGKVPENYKVKYIRLTDISADDGEWAGADIDAVVAKNIIVGQNIVNVTFDSCGGDSVNSQELIIGEQADTSETPTKTGYEFSGWYYDESYTVPYEEESYIDSDTTLYAKWESTLALPTIATEEISTVKDGKGIPAKGWKAEFVQGDDNAQPSKLIWNISSTLGETITNPEIDIITTLSGGATVRYGIIITGTEEQLGSLTVEAALE